MENTLCRNYIYFLYRARLITIRPLKQGYVAIRSKLSLQKFYGRHHKFVDRNGVFIFFMRTDLFRLPWTWLFIRASASRKAEDPYPTRAPCPFSKFDWSPSCSITFVYFGYFKFFVVCFCFPCLVFDLDLFFISARILVLWITHCSVW